MRRRYRGMHHLAREVVHSSVSPPHWNGLEWAIARSVASMQGISALLAHRLRWRGPRAWELFLAQQREQSLLREALIGRLLQGIDAAARDAGVGCIALKGSALRALELYGPGERPMGDVDLLVRKADSAAIAEVMRALDYVPVFDAKRHVVYTPRGRSTPHDLGEHVDNPVPIEIHTLVSEPLPFREVDITSHLEPRHAHPGLNPYPSFAALLLHLLLHAAGNMNAHAMRQIQLEDVALLSGRLEDADWQWLLEMASTADHLWWAFPPLALTLRYYECPVPAALMRELRRNCPRVLRAVTERKDLTAVSWSNLRISAFPGIAWSRTPSDVFRYMRSRALPDRDTLESLRTVVQLQPHMQQLPWYQLSQGKRIVRWLLTRPPRVQTMTSVNAALRNPEA